MGAKGNYASGTQWTTTELSNTITSKYWRIYSLSRKTQYGNSAYTIKLPDPIDCSVSCFGMVFNGGPKVGQDVCSTNGCGSSTPYVGLGTFG